MCDPGCCRRVGLVVGRWVGGGRGVAVCGAPGWLLGSRRPQADPDLFGKVGLVVGGVVGGLGQRVSNDPDSFCRVRWWVVSSGWLVVVGGGRMGCVARGWGFRVSCFRRVFCRSFKSRGADESARNGRFHIVKKPTTLFTLRTPPPPPPNKQQHHHQYLPWGASVSPAGTGVSGASSSPS